MDPRARPGAQRTKYEACIANAPPFRGGLLLHAVSPLNLELVARVFFFFVVALVFFYSHERPGERLQKTNITLFIITVIPYVAIPWSTALTDPRAHLEGLFAGGRLRRPANHEGGVPRPLPLPRLRAAVLGCYPHLG